MDVVDHNGNHFDSYREMAATYGISYKTLATRLHRGFSIKDALTLPLGEAKTKTIKTETEPVHKVFETKTDALVPELKEPEKETVKTPEPKVKKTEKAPLEKFVETRKVVTGFKEPETFQVEHIKCIDAAIEGLKGIEAFCIGNALKCLFGFKEHNGADDLRKAIYYINHVIEESNDETS
ncbi:MAG: hypothetical protein ACI4M9_03940 [Succinivibrio sp.]